MRVLLLALVAASGSGCDRSVSQPASAAPAAAAAPVQAPGFEPYTESILDSGVGFEMVPVAGGEFTMGDHDGAIRVQLEPFWIGKCEVRWDEFDLWQAADLPQSKVPDGMSKPTPPYTDLTFNMGREGYPAICMSWHAAREYCIWLSVVTGRFYRLPTEAEWEHACRAGTSTAWSFGDDPAQLDEHAWHAGNAGGTYHPTAQKKPNLLGLHDMHGNVAEWCADHFLPDLFAVEHGAEPRRSPYFAPPRDGNGRPIRFPHAVRGGAWLDEAAALRSSARRGSEPAWNKRDPQIPRSWWYLTEGRFVGFRVVRPLRDPTPDERARFENP